MPIPRLIHKVRCVYRESRSAATAMDNDAREAIQSVGYGKETNIVGQPSFKSLGDAAQYKRGGVQVETNGYILFRFVDLRSRRITLKTGDRFLQVGHFSVDIYVERLEPTAHYGDQNGATMVKAHCRDRMPARQKRGEVC